MYICVCKGGKGGNIKYVRLMENYRNERGGTSGRVVKSFGRLDEMLERDPLSLEKLKKQYSDQSLASKKLKSDINAEELERVLSEDGTEYDDDGFPALNYSYYIFRKLWNEFFNVSSRIDHLQNKYFGARFDINPIILYLISHKIIDPCSVLGSYLDKDYFLGDPVKGVSLFKMYKTYSFVAEYKNQIFEAINRGMDEKFGRERSTIVFYDVTNAYFESPLTDSERIRERKNFDSILQKQALLAKENKKLDDSCFDAEGRVIKDNLPEWFLDEMDASHRFLRMRGPSKEHRTDMPQVSAALLIDSNGFPMDFAVHPGNASEFKTMAESIDSLRSMYNIGGAVVVADRGLNSLGNLQMLLDRGLGFIVAQKVTQFDESVTERMLDRDLYRPLNEEDENSIEYQVIRNWKKKGIPTARGNCISCTLVLTFSNARKKRDEQLLDSWVDKVEKHVKKGTKIGPRRFGWASIAEIENGNERRILGVDKKLVEKKKRFCGFGAIVFKDPPCEPGEAGRQYSGAEIVRLYHHLNRIEECFRAMKSNLDFRPMYVWDDVHIYGHVAICTLALLMLRLIQNILKSNSIDMSLNQICHSLNNADVLVVKPKNSDARFLLSNRRAQYRRKKEHLSDDELVELIRKGENVKCRPKEILKACGLEPLPRISTRHTLAKCLGTRFHRDEDAIPKVHLKLLECSHEKK